MAKEKDLTFLEGETWIIHFAFRDAAGQALDLTGSVVEWAVSAIGAELATFTASTVNGMITITDPTGGLATMSATVAEHEDVGEGEWLHEARVTLASEVVTIQVTGRLTVGSSAFPGTGIGDGGGEPSLFKGVFVSLALLEAAHPTAEAGAWAIIIPGDDTAFIAVWADGQDKWLSTQTILDPDLVFPSTLTDFKDSVRVTTTENIDLATGGLLVVDDVQTVADNRALVRAQDDGSENGLYQVKEGSWIRTEDADSDAEVTAGMLVFVDEGAQWENQIFALLTPDPITVGTTALTFDNIVLPASFAPVKTVSATSYTLLDTDPGRWVRFPNNSNPTATIPGNSTQIAVGAEIWVQYTGSGTLTIAAAGGVSTEAPDGLTLSQNQVFKLKKTAANRWAVVLYGGGSSGGDGSGALTPYDRGSIDSGTETPEPGDGAMQIADNDGAHSWAAPTNTGCFTLTYTNGSSAGAITVSGFDVVTEVVAGAVAEAGDVLEHTVENSIIRGVVYNDGVSKELIVALIEDAT